MAASELTLIEIAERVSYVRRDGNLATCIEFPYQWKGLTTGQRQARMRDIVVEIVAIAESYNCAIAIESLDFSKKKAKMSEESTLYNEMRILPQHCSIQNISRKQMF